MTKDEIKNNVIEQIKTVFDPEIPVNIYDLGLIYNVDVKDNNDVHITMTLTAPGCPVAGILPEEARLAASKAEGVHECTVELTFDPPWDKHMMPEFVKLELGLF